jgi:hypothetical protein
MNITYPKKVIVGFGVVAVLLAATVLLAGYTNIKPAVNDSEAPAMACQAAGTGCPMTASAAVNTQMMASQTESTDCPKTSCTEDCPKPCCAEGVHKGCCGSAEAAGYCAAKTNE